MHTESTDFLISDTPENAYPASPNTNINEIQNQSINNENITTITNQSLQNFQNFNDIDTL